MTKFETSMADDPLIQGLLSAVGKRVEVFAFGLAYIGKLVSVDPENGLLSIAEGVDTAVLELERVEQFNVVEE